MGGEEGKGVRNAKYMRRTLDKGEGEKWGRRDDVNANGTRCSYDCGCRTAEHTGPHECDPFALPFSDTAKILAQVEEQTDA